MICQEEFFIRFLASMDDNRLETFIDLIDNLFVFIFPLFYLCEYSIVWRILEKRDRIPQICFWNLVGVFWAIGSIPVYYNQVNILKISRKSDTSQTSLSVKLIIINF